MVRGSGGRDGEGGGSSGGMWLFFGSYSCWGCCCFGWSGVGSGGWILVVVVVRVVVLRGLGLFQVVGFWSVVVVVVLGDALW